MKISDKFHLEDINRLKNTVLTGKTEDIKWRIQHLSIVSKLLDENKKEIIKGQRPPKNVLERVVNIMI